MSDIIEKRDGKLVENTGDLFKTSSEMLNYNKKVIEETVDKIMSNIKGSDYFILGNTIYVKIEDAAKGIDDIVNYNKGIIIDLVAKKIIASIKNLFLTVNPVDIKVIFRNDKSLFVSFKYTIDIYVK